MFILSPNLGANLTRRRWLVLAGISAVAVVVALLQLTSWALLPADRTDSLAGVATGMVLGTVILWFSLRDADQDERPR